MGALGPVPTGRSSPGCSQQRPRRLHRQRRQLRGLHGRSGACSGAGMDADRPQAFHRFDRQRAGPARRPRHRSRRIHARRPARPLYRYEPARARTLSGQRLVGVGALGPVTTGGSSARSTQQRPRWLYVQRRQLRGLRGRSGPCTKAGMDADGPQACHRLDRQRAGVRTVHIAEILASTEERSLV